MKQSCQNSQERGLVQMYAYSVKERGKEGNKRRDWRNQLAVVERTSNRHHVVILGTIIRTRLTYGALRCRFIDPVRFPNVEEGREKRAPSWIVGSSHFGCSFSDRRSMWVRCRSQQRWQKCRLSWDGATISLQPSFITHCFLVIRNFYIDSIDCGESTLQLAARSRSVDVEPQRVELSPREYNAL